jgi:hypothetical protein
MKTILSLIFLLLFSVANATVYYVRADGNNANSGLTNTAGGAWKTFVFACNNATVAGDVINVASGTYLETASIDLRVGVSIVGADSSNTILQSTVAGSFTYVLGLLSVEGTNGNQTISNIKFDGRGLTNFWAMPINGRSNVEVHHCTFIDYIDAAVLMRGKEGSGEPDGEPATYATGNKFHDNRVINCSRYTSFGTGALWIGGQSGLLVYNNYMTATQRGAGANGWCIKNQLNGGYCKNWKVYNNQFYRDPDHAGTFDFILESFFQPGLEVYNNNFHGGGLDCNIQEKGVDGYSVYIHNNTWDYQTTPVPAYQSCITLEFSTDYATIEYNTANGASSFLLFTPRPASVVKNIKVNNNLSYNMGSAAAQGIGIRWETNESGVNDIVARNWLVNHNTFISTNALYGFRLPDMDTNADSIAVNNNIFQGFTQQYLRANTAPRIDSLFIRNNLLYLNGNSNDPAYVGGTPTNIFQTGIIKANPNLNGSYIPNVGSPAINAATDGGDIGWINSGGCVPPTPPSSATGTPNPISVGNSTTLGIIGGALNAAPNWIWYTGTCGGTQVGTGSTLVVSPATTTTYYVQATACSQSTTCRSVVITVTPTVCSTCIIRQYYLIDKVFKNN